MIRNRPYQPTDNAKVERMQSVTYRWAEPEKCITIDQLNKALERACLVQREQYKCRHLKGQTRIVAYPQLVKMKNQYYDEQCDLEKVNQFLSKSTWVRKASQKGMISFFSQYWNLGTKYKHQDVYIHLNSSTNKWLVLDEYKGIAKEYPNDLITVENVLNLSIGVKGKWYSAKKKY